MNKQVCFNCKDRFSGCHSICPLFIAESNKRDKILDQVKKNKGLTVNFTGFQVGSRQRMEGKRK